MELAADAIRGHKSAHSFATGPVIADPACIATSDQGCKLPAVLPESAHTHKL